MTMLLRKPPKLSAEATQRFKKNIGSENKKHQHEIEILKELIKGQKHQKVGMKR
ncbi:hypothetical protein IUK39_00445 [Priestia aryabhattai]|jgi:hypothetical protein|uniref:hypothetical protein n=1 Tax=Priestia aryabhattai TaxID=412384 RepID=UPI001C0D4A36|nr:hypothetical protein [Priestia aryabhattai]MBU3568658.1 hypothetical protein [Priestia aryabhattai]